ncbi:nickel-dependent hydrogenase large subunit [Thiocapsa marina]|uniref:Nickel-dependent hydrogenase large subunit n=1 Tax=Thiocapsa marina 5811 TaxID=768671 RepID=F9UE99_9GAMM|nr:nickel-dependent hydrogenase large subunit [Thiocapsa marina]EGV17656.1 nickel-dependent hydrogenase large subunit [Thiocapsa marina 5811]
MSDPGGSLEIQLTPSSDGLVCTIVSTRPVAAASAFVGRSPEETTARLPLLFSICARAQAGACAAAFEQASGRVASPIIRGRREAAIAAETIREHLWRILLDWPTLLGEPPCRDDMASALALSNRILSRLDPAGDLFGVGARTAAGHTPGQAPGLDVLLADLHDLLTHKVLGVPPEHWLSLIGDPSGFERWCRNTETVAARLLRSLLESGEASLGKTTIPALPRLSEKDLIARLSAPDWAEFVAAPTWQGQPRETSPFTRVHPLPLIEVYGAGLLVRLAAQLTEVATGLRLLSRGPVGNAGAQPTSAGGNGIGLGRVFAARGLLAHVVRVEDGRVREYRILAPTEWNFHPRGVVVRALESLPPGPEEQLRRQAELLITAIDPCVAFKLTC